MWQLFAALLFAGILAAPAIAIVTIDVGANAAGNVWRPTSCAQVKDGVVLTNIPARTRAVIDGCTIAIASSTAAESAVSVLGSLGANASVEFVRCRITATFTTTVTLQNEIDGSDWSTRHAALRIESDAILGVGVKVLVDQTTVTMAEQGTGWNGNAVLIDANVNAGDDFQFIVEGGSTLEASCENRCMSMMVLGDAGEGTTTRFGSNALLSLDNVTISATTRQSYGEGLLLTRHVLFGDNGRLSIARSMITVRVSDDHGFGMCLSNVTMGVRSSVSIEDTTVKTMVSVSGSHGVRVTNSTFGNESKVAILGSRADAWARQTDDAFGLSWDMVDFGRDGELVIDRSHLSADAFGSVAAVVFQRSAMATMTIALSWSSFTSGSGANSLIRINSVIASDTSTTWTDVTFKMSHSEMKLESASRSYASFVVWPAHILGMSPQSFDSVTLISITGITAFEITKDKTGHSSIGPGATLCLRNVHWGNYLPIYTGPAAFTVPAQCWPTGTMTATPTFAPTISKSVPRSLSVQRPPTNTLTSTFTPSRPKTDSETLSHTAAPTPTIVVAPTDGPATIPPAVTTSTETLQGIGGLGGVVSPLVAGTAVRAATVARASECSTPTIEDPPEAWPPVANPLSFMTFGLSKETNSAAYEDSLAIWGNFVLFCGVVSVGIVMFCVLYVSGAAHQLPWSDLREKAVSSLPPGSAQRTAWVSSIASVQVLGGVFVAVISVLQVPTTAAAVSLMGNYALMDTAGPLVLAVIALLVSAALTAGQGALCIAGWRLWVCRADSVPHSSSKRRNNDDDGAREEEEDEADAKKSGMAYRTARRMFNNGARWQPLNTASPAAVLGFVAWYHAIGDARAPESLLKTSSSSSSRGTDNEDARSRNTDPLFGSISTPGPSQSLATPLLTGSPSSAHHQQSVNVNAPASGATQAGGNVSGADGAHGATVDLPMDQAALDAARLDVVPETLQSQVCGVVAVWRRVAVSGAWWLGVLEPSISFSSGVATGLARAGFCNAGPWIALLLQLLYVLVLALTWPIKAPALAATMLAVQVLQLVSLTADIGLEHSSVGNDTGNVVEMIADWTALVVAFGLALVGILVIAARLFRSIAASCHEKNAASRGAPMDVFADLVGATAEDLDESHPLPGGPASPGVELDFILDDPNSKAPANDPLPDFDFEDVDPSAAEGEAAEGDDGYEEDHGPAVELDADGNPIIRPDQATRHVASALRELEDLLSVTKVKTPPRHPSPGPEPDDGETSHDVPPDVVL